MCKGGWDAVPRDQDVLFKDIKPTSSPVKVSGITLPDRSPLVTAARDFARKHLDAKTFNHSNRIYYYGIVIARAAFPDWKIDEETYYLTCLLHDIGLADAFHLTTKMSFEFKGAIVARDFLLEKGATEDQADSVCEAIIRHQDIFVTGGNIHQIGQLIQLSTLFDNAGKFAEFVHEETIRSVVDAFPRNEWSETFACAVEKEMRAKPWSHTTTFEKPNWRQPEKGSNFGDTARANNVMKAYD